MSLFSKIKEGIKQYWQIIVGLLFLFFAILFFAHSGAELKEISKALKKAHAIWIVSGVGLSIVYVVLQGFLYYASFKVIDESPTFISASILYLKRLLISVLLPAGGLTSLAFSTEAIEEQGISKPKIYFASFIYLFSSCTSILILSIPAILVTYFVDKNNAINPIYLIPVLLIIIAAIVAFLSFKNKTWAYSYINKHYPSFKATMNEIDLKKLSALKLIYPFVVSILLDLTGILFAYVAMQSINDKASVTVAFLTYVIVFIIGMISPFMNGLGAIEAALTYLFKRYGFSPVDALLTAFIYRFFSFWIPLVFSILSYISSRDSLFLKVFPALISLLLGLINIITLLFPREFAKQNFIQSILSDELSAISSYTQFAIGIILIINAIYLFKGHYKAWLIACISCFISTFTHLTKGAIFEYSILSFLVLLILIYTRKNYQLKVISRDVKGKVIFSAMLFLSVFVYGTIGFYYMDKIHFGIIFNLRQALLSSIDTILLIGDTRTVSTTVLGEYFILSIRVASVLCFLFLVLQLIRPLFKNRQAN